MKRFLLTALCASTLLASTLALGEEVGITADLFEVEIQTEDGPVAIRRDQDTFSTIDPNYSMTSRPCPPFCIQPMSPAAGVSTVGELELIDFLREGRGLLIDGRTENYYFKETIPGAINMPYTEMAVQGGAAVLQRRLVRAVADRDPGHGARRLPTGAHLLLPRRHAGLEIARPDHRRGTFLNTRLTQVIARQTICSSMEFEAS